MAKHSKVWNENAYNRYLNEGRGQGYGSNYKPWIRVQDFASIGIVSRIAGRKTGRIHHFLSNNELHYFYLLEWSDKVIDIREQYPLLDLECAADIAKKAGIKYPKDNISGFPYVMTCDFMITTEKGLKARTIKHTSSLKNRRTLEKLEIERRYWTAKGIDWKLVTENEICKQKARNIEWVYTASDIDRLDISVNTVSMALSMIQNQYQNTNLPISTIAEITEMGLSLNKGVGLNFFKYLIVCKEIAFEINKKISINECRAKRTAVA